MVSVSESSNPTKTESTATRKAAAVSICNETQRKVPSPPSDGLTIRVPRRVSGNLGLIQQILLFGGILMGLLHMAYKMGSMVRPNGTGKPPIRFVTSPVNRMQQRKEILMQSIFEPLIKIALKDNPDAFGWTGGPGSNPSDDPCGLYLGPSSIPESGRGWFAGKDYTAGESIRTERRHLHFIAVPRPLPTTTTNTQGNSNSNSNSIAPWSSLLLLLKPHSVLANVKWEDYSSPLPHDEDDASSAFSVVVATRDIKEGEELFLSWEDHPYRPPPSISDYSFLSASDDSNDGESRIFDHIFADILPFPEQFLKADEHIREARTRYFGAINHTQLEIDATKTKGPRSPGGHSNARWNRAWAKRSRQASQKKLYEPESTKVIETGLRLWQSTIEAYDPLVAKLLPTRVRSLAIYHYAAVKDKSLFSSSSLLGSLRNQTVQSLARTASCVSSLEWQVVVSPSAATTIPTEEGGDATVDASPKAGASETATTQPQQSCTSSSQYRQVVTRKRGFSKGDIVGLVPLLVMQQTKSTVQEPCLPLTSSYLSSPSEQPVVICPLGGIREQTRDVDLANVEYRWSDSSTMDAIPMGVKSLFTKSKSTSISSPSPLSLEEEREQKEILLKKFPVSMSWDIVALRDLQQNETVVIYQPEGIIPFVGSVETIL